MIWIGVSLLVAAVWVAMGWLIVQEMRNAEDEPMHQPIDPNPCNSFVGELYTFHLERMILSNLTRPITSTTMVEAITNNPFLERIRIQGQYPGWKVRGFTSETDRQFDRTFGDQK